MVTVKDDPEKAMQFPETGGGRSTSPPPQHNISQFNASQNALHKHDGRGLRFLSVLCRMQGSIIPRTMPLACFSAFLTIALLVTERLELVDKAYMPILKHPISVQMFGVVLGYVVVLRSNVALERYFEAISNVQFFGSKWVDAYTQLAGFIRTSFRKHRKDGKFEKIEDLEDLHANLLHWFSALHGLAINSLQITQLDLKDNQYFSRLRAVDLPSTDMLGAGRDSMAHMQQEEQTPKTGGKRRSKKSAVANSDLTADAVLTASGLPSLTIIGGLTDEEMEALVASDDKVDLVHSWIIEGIAQASLEHQILTPAPILSRVYQELSNGMLGYNQAYKIALVQFPFAFAQMLTLFLFAWMFCCPVAMYVFTGGEFLTPALTLLTVLGFWGIHEIAVEVENPFGVSPNQLPMAPLHDAVCESLFEAAQAILPKRRQLGNLP